MPKFKIHYSFGFVGSDHWEIIDADNVEEAQEIAYDMASERIDAWAEPVEEDGEK